MSAMNSELDEIKEWINGKREYSTGVTIVEVFLPECPALSMLKRGAYPEKLFEIIKERYYELKEQKSSSKEPIQKLTEALTNYNPQSGSILLNLKDQIIRIRKKQDILHADLFRIGRDRAGRALALGPKQIAKRFSIAEQLVELDIAANKIMLNMDYYRMYGELPEKTAEAKPKRKPDAIQSMSDAAKIKELISVRNRITKNKKKIESARAELESLLETKDRTKILLKLEKWESIQEDLIKRKKNLEL